MNILKKTASSFGRIIPFVLVILTVINIAAAGAFILRGDLTWTSDIARDFLLFEEVMQKKLVLIGPRASGLSGLYHGPLWTYLNVPSYIIGQGNPAVVGAFWFLLTLFFYGVNFTIAKKMFGGLVPYLYVYLLSFHFIEYGTALFNPYGALFLFPLFFYLFFTFIQKNSFKHLLLSFLALGGIIQFQMVVGIPTLLLSTMIIIYKTIKEKQYKWLSVYFLLLIPFASYILFDIRHQFQEIKSIFSYVGAQGSDPQKIPLGFEEMLSNRISIFFTTGLQLIPENAIRAYGMVVSNVFGLITFFIIQKNKDKTVVSMYKLFIYFYIGFYFLTLFHRGNVLFHYYFPFLSLTFLFFSASSKFIEKKYFLIIFLFVVVVNSIYALDQFKMKYSTIGQTGKSWLFYKQMTTAIFDSAKGQNFGYFIYAPDILGYQQKASMMLTQKQYINVSATVYEKKPITYIFVEPPPKEQPWMNEMWWKANRVHIDATIKPVDTLQFKSGYKADRFEFTNEEIINYPSDPDVNDWLHYR